MRDWVDARAFHDAGDLHRLCSRAPPWPERDAGRVFAAFDGLNFSGNDLELARRHCARDKFFHLRRHAMAMNIPPRPCMSQESPARRNGKTLPQLLGEWPYAVDYAPPVAALQLGSTGHFAEPANQFGDFAPKRNINSVNCKRDNRTMGLGEKSATGDCSNRSFVSAV